MLFFLHIHQKYATFADILSGQWLSIRKDDKLAHRYNNYQTKYYSNENRAISISLCHKLWSNSTIALYLYVPH